MLLSFAVQQRDSARRIPSLQEAQGDMLAKSLYQGPRSVATSMATGIGGMAGGLSSMLMQYGAGELFVYAGETNLAFMGFEGKPAGYFIIFCICAVAYLAGWCIMKALVPRYKPIVTD